jgi:hypothetical protein
MTSLSSVEFVGVSRSPIIKVVLLDSVDDILAVVEGVTNEES